AVRNAIEDAGLQASDVDGMLSYQSGDSTFSTFIAGDLGLRLNFYMDVFGGSGARAAAPVMGDALHGRAYGWQSAGQMFAPTFMRHMHDYGTTPEQVAHVKHFHS